ncbi:hypothetical protein [Macrococcus carouselicus]|uniref:Uncharacterized protein n=1 Tax=Macrococcus carouselicus TaxID=69969 RepID=A0A9Q8FPW4_9STAP|nr:hypothetical protein [Macrococcus carouselicus]TDL94263.1 hypothetical protein ERX40_11035 [Macrococcus carouselicus]
MTSDNKLIVLKCIRDNINPKNFGIKDGQTNRLIHSLLNDNYLYKSSDDKIVFFKHGSLRKFKLTDKAKMYIKEFDID